MSQTFSKSMADFSKEEKSRLNEAFQTAGLPSWLNSFPRRYEKALLALQHVPKATGCGYVWDLDEARKYISMVGTSDFGSFNKSTWIEFGKAIEAGLSEVKRIETSKSGKARARKSKRDREGKFKSPKKKY